MQKKTPLPQNREVLKEMSEAIQKTFSDFDVPIKMVDQIEGCRFYHFYLQPEKPVRMKSVLTFEDDLRYALGSSKVTIQAPIPDQKLIGITVSKKELYPEFPWADVVKTKEFKNSSNLTVPLGVSEFGESMFVDIASMPHALIAGTTGSGKSVLLHSIISSLLEKNTPDTLRFILCDPKRVEFAVYNGLPELLTPVISDARKTLQALTWAIKEMARRYDILAAENVQNIAQYHEEIYRPAIKAKNKSASEIEALPYIVIVMDELADIMYAYPKEMEALLIRLAQMSRAVGIHLLLATQRPTSTVLTAAIKANIPTRIALSLASYVDSRMVIDQNGAEKLSGQGDMLYLNYDSPVLHRIQAYSLTDSEIQARVNRIKKEKHDVFTLDLDPHSNVSFNDGTDDLYEDAKAAVIEAGKASTSYLQRKLRIGYSRAALLIDMLEANGVIGPADGASPRVVIENKE